ncbi:MAG: hypothetical protein U9R41_07505 [Candidatus Marinimicrobia bacterium]|nr:hypothetical protein [Candidatus Neomarinimicrobiota bacterium]
MIKKNKIFVFFILVLIFQVSCKNIFAPQLKNFTDERMIFNRFLATPNDVLENFQYSYIYRDSLIYSNLFDSDFVFIYYNADDNGGSGHYDSWLLEVELKTTGRIFRAFSHINLIWNSTLDSNFSYFVDDSLIVQQDTLFSQANSATVSKTFELNLGDEIVIEGTANYEFVKKKNDEWKIYKWRDESY